jgi:hypothetical protein
VGPVAPVLDDIPACPVGPVGPVSGIGKGTKQIFGFGLHGILLFKYNFI